MAMFHLLKTRTSIDIFKNEKCKVTFSQAKGINERVRVLSFNFHILVI